MVQWTWCFIADWCAELACVMLCFVCLLVFCCVAGGQETSDWRKNTSLKDNSWGNYSGLDRTERCEPCLGAPFLASGCLLSLAHVSLSLAAYWLWHMCFCLMTINICHKCLAPFGHIYLIVFGTWSSV